MALWGLLSELHRKDSALCTYIQYIHRHVYIRYMRTLHRHTYIHTLHRHTYIHTLYITYIQTIMRPSEGITPTNGVGAFCKGRVRSAPLDRYSKKVPHQKICFLEHKGPDHSNLSRLTPKQEPDFNSVVTCIKRYHNGCMSQSYCMEANEEWSHARKWECNLP